MAISRRNKFAAAILAVAAVTGMATAEFVVPFVAEHEGEILAGYLDPVGIATKCYGDTNNVIVGKEYSQQECLDSLAAQIIAHAKPVLECTPSLEGHPHQLAAATSLAYNIGPNAYCRSTVARRFNSGDWRAACHAFGMWVKAGGKTLPGLVRRRADEMNLCLTNLPEGV